MVGGMNLPPIIQMSVKLCCYIFVSFQKITFKLGNFTDLKDFFFSHVDRFLLTGASQALKKPWNGPLSGTK